MTELAPPMTPKGLATRDRLLAAARDEAVRTGGLVEVAAVAASAGVVASLINRYFGSKSGLVSALVDDFFDRLHTQVLDLDLGHEGVWAGHERHRLELGVRFHYADPFAVVLYTQLARDPDVMRTEAQRIEAVVQHAAASVRAAQRRHELPTGVDPEFAGAAMFGAMRQVMVAALRRTPHPPQHRVVETLWRQVAASVGLDPTLNHTTRTEHSR